MQEAGVEEVGAALYLEGVAQAEQGNLAEAVHALRQCVQAEPEHGKCSDGPTFLRLVRADESLW